MILGVGAGCPEGWVSGGESCYRFYGNAKNWKDARVKCRDIDASLLAVESAQENHFLSNAFALTQKGRFGTY